MSIPYSAGKAFTTATCIRAWEEYPLQSEGDLTAKVYHHIMVVARDSYALLAKNALMTDAASKPGRSPFADDSGAYWIGDSEPSVIDGGINVQFDRKFATIPADRPGVLSGSQSFPFPGVRGVRYVTPATADEADESDESLWEYYDIASSNTDPAPLYIDYEYFLSANVPTIPSVFQVTQDGKRVDYVSSGLTATLTNKKAANGETFSAAIAVSATSPTASAYATSISSGDLKIVDVSIERYRGDIFVMKTFKMKAQ